MNAKTLWNAGGYGRDNDYYVSMKRIRQHGEQKGIKKIVVDMLLAGFFQEIKNDPHAYISDTCVCGCEIGNSGTNAIHSLFKQLDAKAKEMQEKIDLIIDDDFNKMIKRINQKNKTSFRSKALKFIGYGSFEPPWRS